MCRQLEVPVVVKEVGSGISAEVAMRLKQAGVKAIDVAGRGGTSWYAVEAQRAAKQGKAAETTFADWGIPTEEALVAVRQAVPDLQIIGSGGIRTGLDIAKCLALGADMGAFGQPLLAAALESPEKVVEFIRGIIHEIRVTMLCVGAKNLDALKRLLSCVVLPDSFASRVLASGLNSKRETRNSRRQTRVRPWQMN